MDTEGTSFRDNVHASIMPRRPIIKRRHVFFVLASEKIDACTSPQARRLSLPPRGPKAEVAGRPGVFP